MTGSLAATLDAGCLLDKIRDWWSLHNLHAAVPDEYIIRVMQEWTQCQTLLLKMRAR